MGIETKLAVGEFIQLPKGKSPARNGVISEGCAEHSIQISQKVKVLGSNAHTYGIITDTGLCHRLIVKETRWDFNKGEADIYNEIIEISSVNTLSPEQLRVLVPL